MLCIYVSVMFFKKRVCHSVLFYIIYKYRQKIYFILIKILRLLKNKIIKNKVSYIVENVLNSKALENVQFQSITWIIAQAVTLDTRDELKL